MADTNNFPPLETPIVSDDDVASDMPTLPECNMDIGNKTHGYFHSNQYPQYSHNQDCVYRISVPEGMTLEVTIVDLYMEWS